MISNNIHGGHILRIAVGIITLAILLLAGSAGAATPISACTTISSAGTYVLIQSIVNSTDSDKDGICDPPYMLDSNNTDYLQLTVAATPLIPTAGSISGYKINDTNGNGKWDAGENGISNWTTKLIGITGTGKGTKVIRKETFTDAMGFYKFDNLQAGRYIVIEKLKKGFVPTSSPVKRIKLAQNQISTNNNFTNKPIRSIQTIPTSKILPLSSTELKYYLLEHFSNFFYCDPDIYPVARYGAEEEHALEQFPDIQKNTEEFQAILRHTNLEGITNFSAEQKLLIYREFKKLNAIALEPSGEAYKFKFMVSENGTSPGFFNIEGIIDNNGTITILRKERLNIFPCPICLAWSTRIDTPTGSVTVKDLKKGMAVWTADSSGIRIPAIVLKNVSVPVPPGYRIVHIVLDDGRELFASPGHPTADGRKLGTLSSGDTLDGAKIVIAERVPYEGTATYDILPSGDTGLYWANDILIKSTLI
jgi:hypothetical protein